MATPCAGPFLLNPFPYKWFHKQNESAFKRTRKRIYYALRGEGLREGIPHFIVASRIRAINRNKTEDQHGRVRQPHIGLLDWDPLTLLSLGRIYLSQKMYKKASDLQVAGKTRQSRALSVFNGIFSFVIGFPLSVASTFYSIATALPKILIAALLSVVLAGITRIFYKEDTSNSVIEPTPPPPPSEQEIAFFNMRKYARGLAQVKRGKGLGNGHLPPEIMAKIAIEASKPANGEIKPPPEEKLPPAVRTAVRRRFDFFREEVSDAKIVELAAIHYCTKRPEDDTQGALNNLMY
jgi:hypothetical protein